MVDFLRQWRNAFFGELAQKRSSRILMTTFAVATVWLIADIWSGNFTFDSWDSLICMGFGVVIERIIPWGKSNETEALQKLKKQNAALGKALKESNEMFLEIQENFNLTKKK